MAKFYHIYEVKKAKKFLMSAIIKLFITNHKEVENNPPPTNRLIFSFHFFIIGGSYMVVDCGGGTVDITVHEISTDGQQLREVFKATGGPYGSVSKRIFFFIFFKLFGGNCFG